MAKKRIGEVLIERRAITPAQLEAALTVQKRTRQRLGATLVQQGLITESQLAAVLGESLELPAVDLTIVQVDWSAVHLLRDRFCEIHEVFPYAIEGKGTPNKRLVLAMSDPLNTAALEEAEFTTGLKVIPRVATLSQVRAAILKYYHKVDQGLAPAPLEEEVVVGEMIISQANMLPPDVATPGDPSLEALIEERRQAASAKKKATGLSNDLGFLFGAKAEEDEVDKLTQKFWALMRIMARKGLITREEFLKELDEDAS